MKNVYVNNTRIFIRKVPERFNILNILILRCHIILLQNINMRYMYNRSMYIVYVTLQ